MPLPPFARGRPWRLRMSHAGRAIRHRVWYDPTTDREYERDPNPQRGTWHEIDWRRGRYRDLDPLTGQPIAGSEGRWRPLK